MTAAFISTAHSHVGYSVNLFFKQEAELLPTKCSDGLDPLTKTVGAAGQKEHDSAFHFQSKYVHFSNARDPRARVRAPLLAPAAAPTCQPTLEGADMISPGFHADLGVVSPAAFPFCLKWSNMKAHKVCTGKNQRGTDRGSASLPPRA